MLPRELEEKTTFELLVVAWLDLLTSLRELVALTAHDLDLREWIVWLICHGDWQDATRIGWVYSLVFSAGDAWGEVRRKLRNYLIRCCVHKLGTSRWFKVDEELLEILGAAG